MISVLLVEDEELELKALEEEMDYASLGMEIVGKAYNGEEALRLLHEYKPDLLITDIVMPKISGIELARRAKELREDMRVIIITGHQRFDFASLAIECGVEGFLVKPLLPERFHDLLHSTAKKITDSKRRLFEEELYAGELRANLPLLRELFVRSLMDGNLPADAENCAAYYGITLTDDPLSAFCLLPEEKGDLSQLSLRRCIEMFFQREKRGFCCAMLDKAETDTFCVLLQTLPKDERNALCSLAERLMAVISADCGISLTIGVGDAVSGWSKAVDCVSQARQALEYRFYLGGRQVIFFGDISPTDRSGVPQTLRRLFQPLLAAADRGDRTKLESLSNEFFLEASRSSLPPDYLRALLVELMNNILSLHWETGLGSDSKNKLCMRLLRSETLEEMFDLVKKELFSRSETVGKYIVGREQWLVSRIKEIVNKSYTENLTIDDIAGQIYISSGYAARLFRKHTGESINTFVTCVRMNAAAETLKDPSISIGEAALKTGYSNIAYFSSVFRKTFECTPREWRDSHAGDAACTPARVN